MSEHRERMMSAFKTRFVPSPGARIRRSFPAFPPTSAGPRRLPDGAVLQRRRPLRSRGRAPRSKSSPRPPGALTNDRHMIAERAAVPGSHLRNRRSWVRDA
jgi:hypothetical protein